MNRKVFRSVALNHTRIPQSEITERIERSNNVDATLRRAFRVYAPPSSPPPTTRFRNSCGEDSCRKSESARIIRSNFGVNKATRRNSVECRVRSSSGHRSRVESNSISNALRPRDVSLPCFPRANIKSLYENLFSCCALKPSRHRYKEFPFFTRAFFAMFPLSDFIALSLSFSLAFVCALFRARGETRLLRDVQCAHTPSSLSFVVLVVAEGRRSREMPEKDATSGGEKEREREDERLSPSTRANGEASVIVSRRCATKSNLT